MNGEATLHLDLQTPWESSDLPAASLLRAWTTTTVGARSVVSELTVRFVGEEESRRLNGDFRGVDRPTNVLSFPFEVPPGVDEPLGLLGDIVVCGPVVEREADEQGKPRDAHYAHMVVHGVLHLLGHDHRSDDEARAMEALETEILGRLGYPDPYCVADES